MEMPEPDWSRLQARIERLERRNRFSLAAIALLACVGLVAAAGASRSAEPVVRAEAFELIDAEGRELGRWSTRESSPELSMYDSEGRRRIRLGHSKKTPRCS